MNLQGVKLLDTAPWRDVRRIRPLGAPGIHYRSSTRVLRKRAANQRHAALALTGHTKRGLALPPPLTKEECRVPQPLLSNSAKGFQMPGQCGGPPHPCDHPPTAPRLDKGGTVDHGRRGNWQSNNGRTGFTGPQSPDTQQALPENIRRKTPPRRPNATCTKKPPEPHRRPSKGRTKVVHE